MDALREQVEEIQALQATYPEDGALQLTAAEKAAFDLAVALITTGEDATTKGNISALPPPAAQSVRAVFQENAADQEASQPGMAEEGAHSQVAIEGAQTDEHLGTGTSEPLPQLSGTLVLQDLSVSGQPVSLHFTLPAGYPATEQPRLQIDCACDREHHDELTTGVCEAALEYTDMGGGCLLAATAALHQEVDRLLAEGCLQSAAPEEAAATAAAVANRAAIVADSGARTLCRCVVWFHHIKALSKRKAIVQWASELHLGGYSKPGFPGVIVCEGLHSDVQEYLSRLRALKWQAMAVRGMEECPLISQSMGDHVEAATSGANGVHISADPSHAPRQRDPTCESQVWPRGAHADVGSPQSLDTAHLQSLEGARRFKGVLAELPEEGGMAQLAAGCRAAGLGQLYLTALKISK
mmetsp:Transcript_511/g.1524  ORF Transcript_511/g.1524 Transcript_511/m.1524 type:complete len:411 (+) Transcript_511:246-1478(+)